MDWLANLFLGAFLFGLLVSIGSLILGVGHLDLAFGVNDQNRVRKRVDGCLARSLGAQQAGVVALPVVP